MLCDFHNVDKTLSVIAEKERRYNSGDVQCDDIAEWRVDDELGNVFNVCTNHIGYVFHGENKTFKVSPIEVK